MFSMLSCFKSGLVFLASSRRSRITEKSDDRLKITHVFLRFSIFCLFSTTPPPVAITTFFISAAFFITSHSVFLKYSSPHLSKISLIVIPSCSTIISSVSTRLYFEISEIALLISVLPVAIKPVSTIFIFRKPPF